MTEAAEIAEGFKMTEICLLPEDWEVHSEELFESRNSLILNGGSVWESNPHCPLILKDNLPTPKRVRNENAYP